MQCDHIPTKLTFTAFNWNHTQTVRVTAVNDDLNEYDFRTAPVLHSLVLSDADQCVYSGDGFASTTRECTIYNKYIALSAPSVTSVIFDNDISVVQISHHTLYLEERAEFNSSTSYDVVLLSQP